MQSTQINCLRNPWRIWPWTTHGSSNLVIKILTWYEIANTARVAYTLEVGHMFCGRYGQILRTPVSDMGISKHRRRTRLIYYLKNATRVEQSIRSVPINKRRDIGVLWGLSVKGRMDRKREDLRKLTNSCQFDTDDSKESSL